MSVVNLLSHNERMTLERLLDLSSQRALAMIEPSVGADPEDASFSPYFTLVDGAGDILILVTSWASDAEKLAAVEAVKSLMREIGTEQYAFSSEVWMVTDDSPPAPGSKPPSERPDRREGIMTVAADRTRSLCRLYPLERSGKVITLGDPEDIPAGQGRMAELLK